jgi:hypothetical protein
VKEEYTLGGFENRMPRKIFGRKREKLTGDPKKLHIEKLHHLCSPSNKIPAIKVRRKRRWDMWHLPEREELRTGF